MRGSEIEDHALGDTGGNTGQLIIIDELDNKSEAQ
jgi:hypothetical protein